MRHHDGAILEPLRQVCETESNRDPALRGHDCRREQR
jgi:hypothetical protein